jgi:8-oxo-dGTP pyrophosphatase MutT (NUDIX family)
LIDTTGRFLLQQRDDIPGIVFPGMVGLFGGHREGDETFLDCAVRELHEELSYFIPPDRFEHLWSYDGPDWVNERDTLHGEFFVVRDIPVDKVTVTEGTLLIVEPERLIDLSSRLTPGARDMLARFSQAGAQT